MMDPNPPQHNSRKARDILLKFLTKERPYKYVAILIGPLPCIQFTVRNQ